MPIKARGIIARALQARGNQWMSSAAIQDACPELTKAVVYTSLSGLKAHGVLEATEGRPANYRLTVEWQNWNPGEAEPIRHVESGDSGAVATDRPDAVVIKTDIKEAKIEPVVSERKEYVRWTDEEREIVAKRVMEIRAVTPYLSTTAAYHEAMMVLSPDRHRRVRYVSELNWLIDLIDQLKQQGYTPGEKSQGTVESAVGSDYSEASVVTPAPAPEIASMDLISLLAGRAMQSGIGILREVLTQAITDGIVGALRSPEAAEIMQRYLERREAPRELVAPARHNPLPRSVPKDRLKRVLVMGLAPRDIGMVEKDFKGALDIRYWDMQKSHKLILPMVKNVDITLCMIDHLSHESERAVKQTGLPFIRVNGGVNQLLDALIEVYANE